MRALYSARHGGPFDRGAADSYYRRGRRPHYYEGKSILSKKVVALTPEELAAYHAGYDANEAERDFKDWGFDCDSPEPEAA
jgi:hypothetical protein